MSTIILCNGASSSGKSTFIKQLLPELNKPFYYYSSDKLVDAGILPEVDRKNKNLINSWNIIRPKFFESFHRSIKAFADSGNDVIVEHVIEFEKWFYFLSELLRHHKVYYVKVYCPIDELSKREIERGDRFIGEGKSHIEDGIHTWSSYDLEIDTFNSSPTENIQKIKDLLSENDTKTIFDKLNESHST